MPLVKFKLWKGVSESAMEKIIFGMTRVLTDLRRPEQAVEVIVQEIPKAHWGVAGHPASKSMRDEKPP